MANKKSLVIFLPDGKTQNYNDVSGLRAENGLTVFHYKAVGNRKVTTSLPVLLDEEMPEARVTTL